MTTITLSTGIWLFVKVPKGADDITTNHSQDNRNQLYVMYALPRTSWYYNYESEDLPPGQWQIFSLSSAVNEELAAQIIECTRNKEYKDYVAYKTSLGKYGSYFMNTALESFTTLMAAHGMYLKNPLVKPSVTFMHSKMLKGKYSSPDGFNRSLYDIDMHEWQSHEAKVGEWIILKKVK